METKLNQWSIAETYALKDKILGQPKYQRKEVWKLKKNQLLVDSILRGIDMPKIYLRKMTVGMFDYEIADGQQRLAAIFQFKNDKFNLSTGEVNGLNLSKIGRYSVGGKKYSELNESLQEKFNEYLLTIAIVEEATNYEIRTLFGRLQMGDSLTPPEIRNAIISNLGVEIDNIALNHNFFANCKINPSRYKHQDYVTHIVALLHYNNTQDLKAPILQQLYFALSEKVPSKLIADIVKCLEWMHQIDKISKKRIKNKWAFVDFFWFFYQKIASIKSIDTTSMAIEYDSFEENRMKNIKAPENLLSNKKATSYDRYLSNYILSFKTDGGAPRNIDKRLATFNKLFDKFITLK